MELTPEEKALIEKRRAEERGKVDEKKESWLKEVKKHDQHFSKIESMVDALKKLDTDNILSYSTENFTLTNEEYGDKEFIYEKVYFTFDGVKHEIQITEHKVYGGGWSRSMSKGIKYRLEGKYNDYRLKWMKEPKTVIKNVKEYLKEDELKKQALAEKENLKIEVQGILKTRYPDAEVFPQSGLNRPDTMVVNQNNNCVVFQYYRSQLTNTVVLQPVQIDIGDCYANQELIFDIAKNILNLNSRKE